MKNIFEKVCFFWISQLIRSFFLVDQIPWSYIRWIAPSLPSKMRGGGSQSHASDARYSASKCQKRTYNFNLPTITRFIMVGLGWFLDQCVLYMQTHRMTCLYDVYVSVKIFFRKFCHFFPRVSPPFGSKIKKIFFWTFFIFCIILMRLHV